MRKALRILGWYLIITWGLFAIPYLYVVIPSRILEAPVAGVGNLIGFLGYLVLGIWLIKRKDKVQ